jgi:hypothetical protein
MPSSVLRHQDASADLARAVGADQSFVALHSKNAVNAARGAKLEDAKTDTEPAEKPAHSVGDAERTWTRAQYRRVAPFVNLPH